MPSKEQLRSERLGVSGQIRRCTWMDLGATAVALVAFIVTLIAVLYEPTAVYLGQKNQLVLLGLLLSIMGLCTQRQIQKLSLLYEARAGKSTLQNYDAILRTDLFSRAASLVPRIVLFLLFALPLILSASYKQFIGGSTTVGVPSPDVSFGFTAAPGYQLIGNGLSLLVEVYLPFWIRPSLNCTYGFNLFIVDNTTAAILDAPLPTGLSRLQASLDDHESITLTAKVNATVTENIDPSPKERYDRNGYWHKKEVLFCHTGIGDDGGVNGAFKMMLAGTNHNRSTGNNDYTEIFLSAWNKTEHQTNHSEAERFVSTRRTCVGVWNVTRLNVSLIDVSSLQTADEINVTQSQQIITNGIGSLKSMFFQFLGEYDWGSRKGWVQPLPGTNGSEGSQQFSPIFNTRTALVAAMIWARITSYMGPERSLRFAPIKDLTSYLKDSRDISIAKQVVTLRRSPWLMIVLAIHPLLTVLAVLAKATIYTTPVGDGFGLISILAGIREEGLEVLRGAALSGTLSQKVRVRFAARKTEGLEYEEIHLDRNSQAISDKLYPKIKYG